MVHEDSHPTLTDASVIATGAPGDANIVDLGPIHVRGSLFHLPGGETIYVFDGELVGATNGGPQHLYIRSGQRIPNASLGTEIADLDLKQARADVQGERRGLPETLTVKSGRLVPAPAVRLGEGRPYRRNVAIADIAFR